MAEEQTTIFFYNVLAILLLTDIPYIYSGKFWQRKTLVNFAISYEFTKVLSGHCLWDLKRLRAIYRLKIY